MADRLGQRVANLAARGAVSLIDDTRKIQRVQAKILAGELRDLLQRVQPYGFSSVPLVGAYPVALLFPFGDRSQGFAFVDDVRHRPTGGAPGDVELYDNRGNRVRLRNGVVEIVAAANLTISVAGTGAVTITGATTLTLQGGATVSVTGDASVTVSGDATLQTGGALNLGGAGGAGVARIGDSVNLTSGLIVGGSSKVKAVA
jgi:phage baseplate assembly protein V